MLQRKQTIWLFLAGAAALLSIKLPFYSGIQQPGVPYNVLTGVTGGTLILLVTIVVAVLAFVAISLYKNRTTQLRISVVAIFVEAILIFLYYQKIHTFTQGTFALTSILHMLIILFFVLAARGINNDEKLVKNSDRLR